MNSTNALYQQRQLTVGCSWASLLKCAYDKSSLANPSQYKTGFSSALFQLGWSRWPQGHCSSRLVLVLCHDSQRTQTFPHQWRVFCFENLTCRKLPNFSGFLRFLASNLYLDKTFSYCRIVRIHNLHIQYISSRLFFRVNSKNYSQLTKTYCTEEACQKKINWNNIYGLWFFLLFGTVNSNRSFCFNFHVF